MEETTATKMQQQFTTIPFHLVEQILYRLPVNLLLQLRCLCKSFNSLISDPIFAKKHLRMSKTRHHLIVSSRNNLGELRLLDSPLPSVFSTSRVTITQTELKYYPFSLNNGHRLEVCSCDGMLCINTTSIHECSAILWNPSIRKFKTLPTLPPLEHEWKDISAPIYSFGYDDFIDSYKIIVVSSAYCRKGRTEVAVHTLGTNYWRRIHDIPVFGWIHGSGIFVSGTINWLVFDVLDIRSSTIVSLDLEKESYQMLPQPDLEGKVSSLGMLMDCLCITDCSDSMFIDVWIMKEYGNKESWTILYHMKNQLLYAYALDTKVLYTSEDDQLLVHYNELGVIVYDYKNGTSSIPKIENLDRLIDPKVYIESLISP